VTVLLWVVNFMNLLMLNLYFLSNWLPTIAKSAGLSTTTAGRVRFPPDYRNPILRRQSSRSRT
jgi:hypothetical protein